MIPSRSRWLPLASFRINIDRLCAVRAAEQTARCEAMVAHLKLLIAKLKHDRFSASSACGHKLLDQLQLELEELKAKAAENAVSDNAKADTLNDIDPRAGLADVLARIAGHSAARLHDLPTSQLTG